MAGSFYLGHGHGENGISFLTAFDNLPVIQGFSFGSAEPTGICSRLSGTITTAWTRNPQDTGRDIKYVFRYWLGNGAFRQVYRVLDVHTEQPTATTLAQPQAKPEGIWH